MRRLALLALASLVVAPAAHAYPWPVRPFNVQHPIRGGFDDPRSLRGSVDPTIDNPLSFHDGVDIQAPDGSPVYSVAPGIVTFPAPSAVAVSGGGVTFGYWHIVPAVGPNQYVSSGRLLGYIRPGAGHVHLAEKRFGTYVNPLRRGGLAPYRDATSPVIRGLVFYRCGTHTELPATAVGGCVDIAVDAYDPPALQPVAPWSDAIWSPEKISWSGIYDDAWRPFGGAAQSVDFDRLMAQSAVRDVYAPGTLQNGPNVVGDYRFWLVRGLDTSSLVGDHTITVTASDTRGNHTTRAFTLSFVG